MANPNDTCRAMRVAGITDAESQRGKDFCTSACPYDHCVVFESPPHRETARASRATRARQLQVEGYSVEAIAGILRRHPRTVQRYLA